MIKTLTIEDFKIAIHLNLVIAELEATKGLLRAAHQELVQIHRIGLYIAECPSVEPDDTMTVRMVKDMAYRLNAQNNRMGWSKLAPFVFQKAPLAGDSGIQPFPIGGQK